MEALHVVIVGAGCFGVSTAVHLLQETGPSRPIYTVTVLDSSDTIPAPDAASTDLNKIVRSSYPDPFYTSFARAAIREWPSLGGAYHE
jgi:sarcosine oxidase / L-pipecolate oxidase